MSKEYLEAFERMTEHLDLEDEYSYKQLFEDEKIIKQALIKAQEQEKALSIIKEKDVDIEFLKSADTFEEYNKLIKFKTPFAIALTQEEFELLKRCMEK